MALNYREYSRQITPCVFNNVVKITQRVSTSVFRQTPPFIIIRGILANECANYHTKQTYKLLFNCIQTNNNHRNVSK